ncbi:hypothetical protein HOLleu_29214 [Holothuria leucospilota]|uniref:THAP-type domain-containing protein n=1 Tax=Holothuria leucospilota TaxID=206669 RepID=A0A9Q1GZB2_HOLLE|nr:hypothetical protein HOLleu_29214 [Holothuria leucospilota]
MVRKCAVRKCSNGLRQLNKWREQDCSIHGSKYGRCICHQPFYLFGFPSEARDANARKEWIKLVNRRDKNGDVWQPKAQDRVCSEHFIDKEPTPKNPYPTLKLGYSLLYTPVFRKLPNDDDDEPTAKRSRKVCSEDLIIFPKNLYPTLKLGNNPYSTSKGKEVQNGGGEPSAKWSRDSKPFSTPVPQNPCHLIQDDHNYDSSSYVCTCKPLCSCAGCQRKQKEIQRLRHEIELLKVENALKGEQLKLNTAKERKLPFPQSILKTDTEVKDYTGLPSKAALQQLSDILKDKASKMRYWTGKQKTISTKVKKKPSPLKSLDKKLGRKRKLSQFEELVLVLMKLRLSLPMGFLGSLFGISKSTCSSLFHTWIKFLASELKCLVFWPGRDLIRNEMPDTVKKLCPTLHCILDCAEFNVERPQDLQIQTLTLSDYKKSNNAKVLLEIASNGMITSLSRASDGNSSGRYVTLESEFYEPGDTEIANSGIPTQDVVIKGHCTLQIPTAAQGFDTQMTKGKVKHAKIVANSRVHVKTAIDRLKHFQILKRTMPSALFPLIYEIVMVCASLTNLIQIHNIL